MKNVDVIMVGMGPPDITYAGLVGQAGLTVEIFVRSPAQTATYMPVQPPTKTGCSL
ncbi:MAG: hypothetical protein IPG42_17720 [Betaproteobacteria bacterium]|jgi:ribulose 1,5-bisphosphate synthetase/thiazole synthase|nr:hypothetical protein [Betaproteobacteria bacterium]MBK7653935.1 hypothetical protein [Betaproteobacteria bacterium]MBP6647468.1 hypothetical protein [Burkholderiaceae bacterium]